MPIEIPFPQPSQIGNRNWWRKRAIREYQAAIAGEPSPSPLIDDEVMINSKQVRALFGGVSDMWIWRRLNASTNGAEAA